MATAQDGFFVRLCRTRGRLRLYLATAATRCNIPTPRLSHVQVSIFRRVAGATYRMRDPIIIPTDEGLFCPAGNFHIDPWRPVATAVITHAHADHARSGRSEERRAGNERRRVWWC